MGIFTKRSRLETEKTAVTRLSIFKILVDGDASGYRRPQRSLLGKQGGGQ